MTDRTQDTENLKDTKRYFQFSLCPLMKQQTIIVHRITAQFDMREDVLSLKVMHCTTSD